jgi:hypothetical protein
VALSNAALAAALTAQARKSSVPTTVGRERTLIFEVHDDAVGGDVSVTSSVGGGTTVTGSAPIESNGTLTATDTPWHRPPTR